MRDLVLASGNTGKLRELQGLLHDVPIVLRPQAEFAVPEVAETGLSFAENALIKARHASRYSGLPALADDSGLAVDALQGAPGIYSARYAGPGASDQANQTKLLSALRGLTAVQRSASFHCVLVYLQHPEDPIPGIYHGVWRGHIALQARGTHGFGYDPIFIPEGLTMTAAELAPAEKQSMSHRAQALQQLRKAFWYIPAPKPKLF